MNPASAATTPSPPLLKKTRATSPASAADEVAPVCHENRSANENLDGRRADGSRFQRRSQTRIVAWENRDYESGRSGTRGRYHAFGSGFGRARLRTSAGIGLRRADRIPVERRFLFLSRSLVRQPRTGEVDSPGARKALSRCPRLGGRGSFTVGFHYQNRGETQSSVGSWHASGLDGGFETQIRSNLS